MSNTIPQSEATKTNPMSTHGQTTEQKLWNLVEDLRAENNFLHGLLLKQANVIPIETVQEMPETLQALGREPWYLKKHRLEESHRKPKLSEVSGIPDELDKQEDTEYAS